MVVNAFSIPNAILNLEFGRARSAKVEVWRRYSHCSRSCVYRVRLLYTHNAVIAMRRARKVRDVELTVEFCIERKERKKLKTYIFYANSSSYTSLFACYQQQRTTESSRSCGPISRAMRYYCPPMTSDGPEIEC